MMAATDLKAESVSLAPPAPRAFAAGMTSENDGSFPVEAVVLSRESATPGAPRDPAAAELGYEVQTLNAALTCRAAQLEEANAELQRQIAVRRNAEAALKESNAELEAFAYSVSHDLRAPLRAMQGFAQALVEDCAAELGETGLDYARRIVSAATRLDALIQDLLVYSRISHNKVELEEVNLGWAVREALGHLEAPLRETGAVVIQAPEYAIVRAHHQTVVQVIANLLSNACKFVAPGTRPEIRLQTERAGGHVRLWVQDNGIGIAPEFHARIFRVFERLHAVEVYPGTGVGLAIVRKGVERMGGRLGLESAPHCGSRFWVELPLAESAAARDRPA